MQSNQSEVKYSMMPDETVEPEFPEDPDCIEDDDYGPDNSDDEEDDFEE